jgi:cytochrome c oxidase subunit 2
MLRRIAAYIALAILAVSCGGNQGDQGQVVEDDTTVAIEEAAEVAVADVEEAAVADNDSGKALYAPCAACHGANGEGNMALNAPGIAGQSESYLRRQLWEFKNGQRGNHEGDTAGAQMRPMAATLADRQAIADVSAYIASLPATVPPATVAGDASNGQKLYISKCGACHGGDAWGNEALHTPRLTMLGDAYVLRQVMNFQEGMRGVDEQTEYGKQMAVMAKTVTAEELNDVAAFVNELGTSL